MSGFLGSYLHQIDEKGRLSLPAAFRREAADTPLVLLQVHPDALSLYPAAAWTEVEGRLRELLRLQPHSRHAVLGITASALEVLPDKQGRIPIPPRLREAAGIDGSALVVGVIDRIEIWNPDRFEAAVAARTPEPDFERFVHQVFG
jgi:MraZ protein